MTDPVTDDGELGGYAESIAEIESILTSLEDDDVDIDTLASKVERASLLIAHCEQRLRATELSLQTILARHESTPSGQRRPLNGRKALQACVDRGSWWALPRSTCASRAGGRPGAHARAAAESAQNE